MLPRSRLHPREAEAALDGVALEGGGAAEGGLDGELVHPSAGVGLRDGDEAGELAMLDVGLAAGGVDRLASLVQLEPPGVVRNIGQHPLRGRCELAGRRI